MCVKEEGGQDRRKGRMKGKAGVEVGGDCVCQLGWDGRGSARWNWVGSTRLTVPGQSYRLDEGCYLELVTKVVK